MQLKERIDFKVKITKDIRGSNKINIDYIEEKRIIQRH